MIVTQEPYATVEEDYAHAALRLLWMVCRKTDERTLLCATVEMYPHEVTPPSSSSRRVGKTHRHIVSASESVVTASEGLRWFTAAESGTATLPADEMAPHAEPLSLSDVAPEPFRGLMTTLELLPLASRWHHSPRVRRLVPSRSPLHQLSDAERAAILRLVQREVVPDLGQFPEYLGALQLVLPNPILRDVEVRQIGNTESGWQLVVAMTPRAHRTVVGLQLLIEEERGETLGLLAAIPVEHPVVRVTLPRSLAAVRERVVDQRRGCIFDGAFGVFNPGAVLNTVLSVRGRHVTMDDPSESYEVSLVVDGISSTTIPRRGDPNDGFTRLRACASVRERQAAGDANQRWFFGSSREATNELRRLFGAADDAILLCDPYFGATDFRRIVLAISNTNHPVRILAGKPRLKQPQSTRQNGAELLDAVREAQAAGPMNPVEIRVLKGSKHPAVHDRFLCFGTDQAWMLGSSLNKFGERGTMMVRVPNPEPLIHALESVWRSSMTLEAWLQVGDDE